MEKWVRQLAAFLWLPADVLHQHILPRCGGTPRELLQNLRTFGLGLRTLNRQHRDAVDKCIPFWVEIIPFDWLIQYRMHWSETAQLTEDSVCAFVLGRAREHREYWWRKEELVINNQLSTIESTISTAMRDIAFQEKKRVELQARLRKMKFC